MMRLWQSILLVWLFWPLVLCAHVPREIRFSQFQFDAANRLTNTISPLGREIRVTFDNRGLVCERSEMSRLEREVHETLPIGREEGPGEGEAFLD